MQPGVLEVWTLHGVNVSMGIRKGRSWVYESPSFLPPCPSPKHRVLSQSSWTSPMCLVNTSGELPVVSSRLVGSQKHGDGFTVVLPSLPVILAALGLHLQNSILRFVF